MIPATAGDWKGALVAPFVFLGSAVAAAGSLEASPTLWTLSLLLLSCGAVFQRERLTPGITAIALAVWGYALWAIANNAFMSPAYTAAAIFNPAFLASGFALGRGLDQETRKRAAAAIAAGIAMLALWGVVQVATGLARAHAHFETPNTLATVINLALAPVLVLIATGERRFSFLGLASVLMAGLVATASRGGVIALVSGLAVAWLLIGTRPRGADLARVFLVVATGAVAGWVATLVPQLSASQSSSELPSVLSTASATLGSRGELYALALSALGDRIWSGIGYLGFNALLEAGRQQVPSFGSENVTYFAHSDYLQTLVELGLPGFGALVLVVLLPFVLARTRIPSDSQNRRDVLAGLAALATMAIHALADFPFYVPICLLLFGLHLGTVERLLQAPGAIARSWRTPMARMTGLILAAVLVTLFVRAPIAEAAAAYANRNWASGNGQTAAYGFELARRFQPGDWRYHWYAGQFWTAQAAQTGNPAAARLADEAFSAGFAANQREPRNLLGRIELHLRWSSLLSAPADAATLRGWADRALALAPLNPAVRREHAAVLAELKGRR